MALAPRRARASQNPFDHHALLGSCKGTTRALPARVSVRLLAIATFIATIYPAAVASADDGDTDINWGIASEFGRGIGLGVERELTLLGGGESVVAGLGFTGGFGNSSVTGATYTFMPGAAVGYRKYLAGFFLGPSIGANVTAASSSGARGELSLSALFDLGYRFKLGRADRWNLRVGLGGGYERTAGRTLQAFALTLSIGR